MKKHGLVTIVKTGKQLQISPIGRLHSVILSGLPDARLPIMVGDDTIYQWQLALVSVDDDDNVAQRIKRLSNDEALTIRVSPWAFIETYFGKGSANPILPPDWKNSEGRE